MIEVFAHGISVSQSTEEDGTTELLIINGKGWEEESFRIWLNEEEAKTLLWQLNFYVGSER